MVVMGEFDNFLNSGCCSAESFENCTDISTWLHRDDSQLVFFVHPHQEGLVVVVEDTSALGPVTVQVASFQESVTLPI